MLTQVKHQLKAHVCMGLCNTHPSLALPFPFLRESGEGCCLANNCSVLAMPPDNALISPPQLSKISRPLPGETETQGEQLPAAQRLCRRQTGAGGLGHGQAGSPPARAAPGLGVTPHQCQAPSSCTPHSMCPPSGLSPLYIFFLHLVLI